MKIGFIGAGNMGAALTRAISKTENSILIYDSNLEKASELASKVGASALSSSSLVIEESDAVFLAVKPNILPLVIDEVRDSIKIKKPLLISMAAGVSLERLRGYIGFDVPMIRIMPNTPVAVMSGMIAYAKNELVTEEMTDAFLDMLKFAGVLDRLDESLIDAETAVAGCGPAFAYMFIDAMKKAGAECGLPEEKALSYAAQTVIGAAKMIMLTGEDPSELTRKVCSPGGSTIEGVKSLEASNFEKVVGDAVRASYKKTREL